ncbi:2-isopropylmalate synthase [Alteribacillus persepolensis]|uniref:Citramalate synthase n=1 Tax=Alteribacillus persepolensis TaxID=568899 RepID=A0A1G7ZPV0_9BACI|nr:citramalate synthase [Alteribacillus persepolensis]SDH10724.1 2-isopropylmalate synthase [Alteribacillus persepolensis]
MAAQVKLYDTTLRDGTQGEGISLSVDDKLKIAEKLDQMGVHYIEGGWPGSNPKDMNFFERAKDLSLQQAVITAFGSTRRPDFKAENDPNLQRILDSGVKAAAIFGKTWDFHVTEALQTTLEENVNMIYDSVYFLKENGIEVIFDAEHFFDGYKHNARYAIETIKAAEEAGADCVALCDTNGGSLPGEIASIVKEVKKHVTIEVGIHCHNDGELGVANTLEAVNAGAVHIQGTINGYGERCGNANLISVIPNLQLKMGIQCVTDNQLKQLTEASKYIHELANQIPPNSQPFTGKSAFAHKGGMHVSAVLKHPETYEHIEPEQIGNERRVLVSELAGQSNLLFKAEELGLSLDKKDPAVKETIEKMKAMEHKGYQYEAAEASFELLIRNGMGEDHDYFQLDHFKIITHKEKDGDFTTEAVVKVNIQGQSVMTAAEGNGPVNALDHALRKTIGEYYPLIQEMYLSDYKVRVLDEAEATASKVRVLIESSDGKDTWSTIGVSGNIIEASWHALVDSIRYYFMKQQHQLKRAEPIASIPNAGVKNH